MTTYAYLRVSTEKGQTTENQRKQIADASFAVDEFISEDGVSGSVAALHRPAFAYMMSRAKEGDTCICTMLDRLGRNTIDILQTVQEFKKRGIKLRVMQLDGVDLTSSTGKMIVSVLATLAEMERDNIVSRTKAGLERTKGQGTKLGAPLTIKPDVLRDLCEKKSQGVTLDCLVNEYCIPRNTIARNVRKWADKLEEYRAEFEAKESQHEGRKVV